MSLSIPICKLPELPLEKVIRFLNPAAVVMLMVGSKTMRKIIKKVQVTSVSSFCVEFLQAVPTISVPANRMDQGIRLSWSCDVVDLRVSNNDAGHALALTNTKVGSVKVVLNQFLDTIPADCSFLLDMNHVTASDLEELLAFPTFIECNLLNIMQGEVKSKDLTLLLKHVKPHAFYVVAPITPNFYHPKPFITGNVYYNDARWIRLEHLFTLEPHRPKNDLYNIELSNTTLSSDDLNRFLHFWSTWEGVSLGRLKIEFYVQRGLEPRAVFECAVRGLTTLGAPRSDGTKMMFIIPRHRKNQYIYLRFQGQMAYMTVYNECETTSDIFDLLLRIDGLQSEMSSVDAALEECQTKLMAIDLDKDVVDRLREQQREQRAKSTELHEEYQDMERRITAHKMFFDKEGRAYTETIVDPIYAD